MSNPPYSFNQDFAYQYSFTSEGRRKIVKVVLFAATPINNVYNLGFGDLLPDGTIDDTSNSNNGDIIKVLATVIQILKAFTQQNPASKIFFSGSTPNRTSLYHRIINTYLETFKKDFNITALVRRGSDYQEVEFEPSVKDKYVGFFIKRND